MYDRHELQTNSIDSVARVITVGVPLTVNLRISEVVAPVIVVKFVQFMLAVFLFAPDSAGEVPPDPVKVG